MRHIAFAALLLLTFAFAGAARAQDSSQTSADEQAAADALAERARTTVETLVPLIETRNSIREQKSELLARIEAAPESEKALLGEELTLLEAELTKVEDQVSVVATGISELQYRSSDKIDFDIRTELENLVKPFLSLLMGATEDARKIENTRRALTQIVEQFQDSQTALEYLDAAIAAAKNPSVLDELNTRRTQWQERREANEAQVAALTQQLDDLLSQRVTARNQVQNTMQVFFRERGLSLVMGIVAFATVLMSCRLIGRFTERMMLRSTGERTFYTRLFSLLFAGFTVAGSFAAMLIVFNLRNDWLLLGLATILMIALVWIGIRMLPGLVEQATVLLNLGAVQEDERVMLNGVPFMVRRLSFYTDFENPALDGGEFTLPVRELVGLHSRPAAKNEAWFPSLKGDWVRLSDGHAGQVIVQTPEMVVIELLGGSRVTYQTSDYLDQTPENLSHGFRTEVQFGIGYEHLNEATGPIIEAMQKGVTERINAFLGAEHVRSVEVEFLRAGASSLDYEVEVDADGRVAHRFEEIERELARILVALAAENGWSIPYQQIVVHSPPAR